MKQDHHCTNDLKIHSGSSVPVTLQVFADYEKLLNSENYVTKRQSLKVWSATYDNFIMRKGCDLKFKEGKTNKNLLVAVCCPLADTVNYGAVPNTAFFLPQLLGELLLDRHNFTVMTRYISKPENLKLMMNLLRDKSPNIQFEAFHVFKVNPKHSCCLRNVKYG